VQSEKDPQPPLLVRQLLIGWQFLPSPVGEENPVWHAQVLVPGPLYEHVELVPQPPLLVRQLLMALHVLILSLTYVQAYPVVHPPLFVEHGLTTCIGVRKTIESNTHGRTRLEDEIVNKILTTACDCVNSIQSCRLSTVGKNDRPLEHLCKRKKSERRTKGEV
jgi:hypothetical protein